MPERGEEAVPGSYAGSQLRMTDSSVPAEPTLALVARVITWAWRDVIPEDTMEYYVCASEVKLLKTER